MRSVGQNINKEQNAQNVPLAEQILAEITKRMTSINDLNYGLIEFQIRDGKLVRWVISESFITKPIDGE